MGRISKLIHEFENLDFNKDEKWGWIYVINSINSCKIGITATNSKSELEDIKSIQKRLESIQCGNPNELKISYLIRGTYTHEALLHKTFEPENIRGEWFHFNTPFYSILARFFCYYYKKDLEVFEEILDDYDDSFCYKKDITWQKYVKSYRYFENLLEEYNDKHKYDFDDYPVCIDYDKEASRNN